MNGGSSTETDVPHPTGRLGFAFFGDEDNDCDTDKICLDLSVGNTTQTANVGAYGIQSSRMVSAGFDVPGYPPPGFGGLSFIGKDFGFISNPLVYTIDQVYNSSQGVFTDLDVTGTGLPGLTTLDLCAGAVNTCQSGGSPQEGLANGESTVVRLIFDYDQSTSVGDIADAFYTFYRDGVSEMHTAGRWQAIKYCLQNGECPDEEGSDKISGGTPDGPNPPGPREEEVPGPLPLMGAVAAFGFSRRLRHRIAVEQKRAPFIF